jgi:hypothetical protein
MRVLHSIKKGEIVYVEFSPQYKPVLIKTGSTFTYQIVGKHQRKCARLPIDALYATVLDNSNHMLRLFPLPEKRTATLTIQPCPIEVAYQYLRKVAVSTNQVNNPHIGRLVVPGKPMPSRYNSGWTVGTPQIILPLQQPQAVPPSELYEEVLIG